VSRLAGRSTEGTGDGDGIGSDLPEPPRRNRRKRRERRVDPALLAGQLVLNLGLAAVFSLLAELQNESGFADWGLGLITGSAFLTSLVTQLSLSRYADRGHARRLLIVGLVVGALSMIWFAFATTLWQLVVARALYGAAAGLFAPASRRIAVSARPERTGEILGLLGAAAIAGFLVGPPVAAGLFEAFGVEAAFALPGVAMLVCLPFVARLPEPAPHPGATAAPGAIRRLLRQRGVVAAVLAGGSFFLAFGIYDSLWARFMDDQGASTVFIGLSFTAYAVPALCLGAWGGRISDRFGAWPATLLAVAGTIPFIFAFGFIGNIWILAGLGIIQSAVDVIGTPGSQAALAERTPPEDLATGQGLGGAFGTLCAAIAGFASGPLYGAGGQALAFPVGAGFMAAVALTAWLIGRSAPPVATRRAVGTDEPGEAYSTTTA
jgi:MFS family permease